MRVLIRYKNKDSVTLHTCIKEGNTMNSAEEILKEEKPDIIILTSSIIENGQQDVFTGNFMLCNTK